MSVVVILLLLALIFGVGFVLKLIGLAIGVVIVIVGAAIVMLLIAISGVIG